MTRGYDEPFTLYGLLAESVETDPARSYVTFALNPRAAFSDGHPVTADDVLFSAGSCCATAAAPITVPTTRKPRRPKNSMSGGFALRLTAAGDRELPLILALLPVLPRHAVNPDDI